MAAFVNFAKILKYRKCTQSKGFNLVDAKSTPAYYCIASFFIRFKNWPQRATQFGFENSTIKKG